MRLAVLSDTHGNAAALEAVMRDLQNQSPDAIVFLGDMVMRGPQPRECIQMVKSLQPHAIIRGNYDDLFTRFPEPGWSPSSEKEELVLRAFEYDCQHISAEDQAWLGNLPTELSLLVDEVPTEMYHAGPDSLYKVVYPWATLEELDTLHRREETRLVLYGHVHHSHVRQGNGRLVVNCGSIGLPFDGDNRASYAIVDIQKQDMAAQIRRVSYDIEKAISIAKDLFMPDVEAFEYALRTARYPYGLKLSTS
ncbi:metallophosphatase family protein [Brevibacillus ruminantium]|uniref:Metallophosphatase family protein n=1 Tax=Brevibacillus ruminantium TaxID=2950604 RepID=A0ABY4WL82_9BACL|nr:metallophosphoesterase family protein [Brevibacillus ruminantium]USG67424.1 metallophosphatase family protein [Brevibacillus ruminantium]